jgi:hypothetical protein
MAVITEQAVGEGTNFAHKRRVNDLIFESLAAYPREGEIAFFCECASEKCFETVWMTIGDYESGRLNPRWSVIRAGHRRPRAPQPAVRERPQAVPA